MGYALRVQSQGGPYDHRSGSVSSSVSRSVRRRVPGPAAEPADLVLPCFRDHPIAIVLGTVSSRSARLDWLSAAVRGAAMAAAEHGGPAAQGTYRSSSPWLGALAVSVAAHPEPARGFQENEPIAVGWPSLAGGRCLDQWPWLSTDSPAPNFPRRMASDQVMVELRGLEPLASCMPCKSSDSPARALMAPTCEDSAPVCP